VSPMRTVPGACTVWVEDSMSTARISKSILVPDDIAESEMYGGESGSKSEFPVRRAESHP
jgi:hypothetical protein